ncbi:hypothetical protein NDU88_006724 [Pleurodeles waltl]|uniref:Uncharacterized protein n=1 Tax=Pleurodeles waltl TaxID=8319 RepID=A0AAV7VS77_PLEWA|nr:hypothetical protein NDU88_006724 [Pleurodeles waltl]
MSIRPSSPLRNKYHPFKGSLHFEEEEQLEDTFRVLTLASGRKEGPDLETASTQWQPEAEPGENSVELPEEERTLGRLRGSTGVEEDIWNCPFAVTQSRRQQKGSNPKQTRRRLRRLFAVELHLPATI